MLHNTCLRLPPGGKAVRARLCMWWNARCDHRLWVQEESARERCQCLRRWLMAAWSLLFCHERLVRRLLQDLRLDQERTRSALHCMTACTGSAVVMIPSGAADSRVHTRRSLLPTHRAHT